LDLFLLLVGAALLYFGAEWLVSGTSALALALRIPQLIVGLTIVAYGTSAPELIVSIEAATTGHGDVALGNVIGSNIANLGLILGISTLIKPALVDGTIQKRELPVLVLSTLAIPAVLWNAEISALEGGLLLLAAVVYSAAMIRSARRPDVQEEARFGAAITANAADAAGAPTPVGSKLKLCMLSGVGLAVLLYGGHLFVVSATVLARDWGMSERMVGLTIVAIGTSLPELATSLIAALRGHSDIAVGNVIGSNIFNVLLCLGAAGLAGSIHADPALLVGDLTAVVFLTLLGALFMRTARAMRRAEGATLLVVYLSFLAYLIVS
jgi:cation:H+ antiporter